MQNNAFNACIATTPPSRRPHTQQAAPCFTQGKHVVTRLEFKPVMRNRTAIICYSAHYALRMSRLSENIYTPKTPER